MTAADGDLQQIVASCEPALGAVEGEPTPMTGGITNRNFRVRFGGAYYAVRVHGVNTNLLAIDRESERLAIEAAAHLGIAPELVAAPAGGLVTRYIECAPLDPAAVAARVEDVALALRRFHDCGVALPNAFSVPRLFDEYAGVVASRAGELPAVFGETRALVGRIAAAMPTFEPRPCHNDLLGGNIICSRPEDRIMLVDWEYAGMGDPWFDLGNLAVNNGLDDAGERRLLGAYLDADPGDRERAALKLARVLSDAREAAWAVVQAAVSDLEFDFPRYGGEHFERLWSAAGRPDFEDLLATA